MFGSAVVWMLPKEVCEETEAFRCEGGEAQYKSHVVVQVYSSG